MMHTQTLGATAPATQAAVATGALILDLQREIAARRSRGASGSGRRGNRTRGRSIPRYNVPPYFPSDVC
jgi:hypothetical protein